MAIPDAGPADRRVPLTRDRVLRVAMELADRDGLDALSMRKLGQELGVDAMALYRHVRNKDDLFDGIIERIVGEIERPDPAPADWKATLREPGDGGTAGDAAPPVGAARVRGTRHGRHRPSSATSRPCSRSSRDGGFSIDLAHHALHVLDSRIFGFNQDLFDDSGRAEPLPRRRRRCSGRRWPPNFPRVTELAMSVSHEGVLGRCDDDVEFAFGLDLILDGLERRRAAREVRPAGTPGDRLRIRRASTPRVRFVASP